MAITAEQSAVMESAQKTQVWAATRLLFSRAEVAKLLGITTRSVDHLVASNRLPSRKLGRRRMFHRDSIECFAGVVDIREKLNV